MSDIEVWTVVQGKKTQVKIDEAVYDIKQHVDVVTPVVETIETIEPEPEYEDVGEVICHIQNTPIYKHVLEEVTPVINDIKATQKIVARYHPNVTARTVGKYTWAYRKHLGVKMERGRRSGGKGYRDTGGEDRGKTIHQFGHNSIHSNVARDVKFAIENKQSIAKVLRRYSPKAGKSSINAYISLYKRYFREVIGMDIRTRSPRRITTKRFTTKGKRYKRKPPEGCVAYDDTYKTFVRQDEIDSVMLAIKTVELNYNPTSEAIVNRSGVRKHRVAVTLHYLRDQNIIKYRINEFGTPIYEEINKTFDKKGILILPADEGKVLETLDYGNFSIEELNKRLKWDNARTLRNLASLNEKGKVNLAMSGEGNLEYRKVS